MDEIHNTDIKSLEQLQRKYLNPFKPSGISHCYQLEQSFSFLRVVGWYFTFYIQISIEHSVSKQWVA